MTVTTNFEVNLFIMRKKFRQHAINFEEMLNNIKEKFCLQKIYFQRYQTIIQSEKVMNFKHYTKTFLSLISLCTSP